MAKLFICKTCKYDMPESSAIIHRDNHPSHVVIEIEAQKEVKPCSDVSSSDADMD